MKLNSEELSTVLSQIEACMNSRPLVALPPDDHRVEALTPGRFLIASKLILICPSLKPHLHVRNRCKLKRFEAVYVAFTRTQLNRFACKQETVCKSI